MKDPYLYDDCPVLRNKLGIRDADSLDKAEVDFSCNALKELVSSPIAGKYDFEHLCAYHEAIFSDVYDWAGEARTIPIEKQEAVIGHMSIAYAKPNNIETEAIEVLKKMNSMNWNGLSLDEQAESLSENMASLWKVHPFREGNTRTTIAFVNQFAEDKGLILDRSLFEQHAAYVRSALVAASAIFPDGDFRKPEYLVNIVKDSLQRGLENKKAIKEENRKR